jgi:hypothetical protein
MTPLQGYGRTCCFNTQGSAALHPGLSNHARSGLREETVEVAVTPFQGYLHLYRS